ncbi:MAG: hypothetical protein AVDCRST_MAG19-3057 [uncultured Thermomicrobiales bacterium]|uniref:Uncharacterized protein n=1 Tax=uncultured Thermomicrobiales bacterium TaxID=1645740 RepID=A0A6J4VCC9_9BACT|nr:MAG: hypothetical protein AVDCRST_MAG19-3057 [uncultured Thermomicrobiales bacterium]
MAGGRPRSGDPLGDLCAASRPPLDAPTAGYGRRAAAFDPVGHPSGRRDTPHDRGTTDKVPCPITRHRPDTRPAAMEAASRRRWR